MSIGDFRDKLAASKIERSVLSTCLAITDTLAALRPGDGRHLGLSFFYEKIPDDEQRKFLLPALSILSTLEGAILEMHGYLDDDGEGQIHLEPNEFRDLLNTGKLAHPHSGKLVSNPMQHVKIFYSLRDGVHS